MPAVSSSRQQSGSLEATALRFREIGYLSVLIEIEHVHQVADRWRVCHLAYASIRLLLDWLHPFTFGRRLTQIDRD